MNKNKFAALVAGAALAALSVACTETANTNTANTNAANTNNSNQAVVVNNNGNTNTSGVAVTNRNYNANISEADYEKDKDRYTKEAKEAGETIGTSATDGWLWVKTKGALAGVDDLEDSNINVDVDGGAITLRGQLPSQAQIDAAVKAANGIEGKKSVKNQLKVGTGESMGTNNKQCEQIIRKLCSRVNARMSNKGREKSRRAGVAFLFPFCFTVAGIGRRGVLAAAE